MVAASAPAEDGPAGNSRLTSTTGMLLLLMLAVEGVTVLRVRQLITLHVYLGLLLLGPVLLKTGSTGFRFVRYYTGSGPYVRKGPPQPVLRFLGPLVILSSLVLLGSGVALITTSPGGGGGLLLTTHKVSFFVWFAVMAVHVLGHLREAAAESLDELRSGSGGVRGRSIRLGLVVLALVAGVATATALMPTAAPWTSRSDVQQGQGDHRPGG
ncbi:MAG: hypothetical protein QOJ11_2478 [Frankiales bacterium]|jgi:hypothetical protein|nr:hypothetical protein [Frankiales bacterium]